MPRKTSLLLWLACAALSGCAIFDRAVETFENVYKQIESALIGQREERCARVYMPQTRRLEIEGLRIPLEWSATGTVVSLGRFESSPVVQNISTAIMAMDERQYVYCLDIRRANELGRVDLELAWREQRRNVVTDLATTMAAVRTSHDQATLATSRAASIADRVTQSARVEPSQPPPDVAGATAIPSAGP
jgi:hypothetical protein